MHATRGAYKAEAFKLDMKYVIDITALYKSLTYLLTHLHQQVAINESNAIATMYLGGKKMV